MERNKALNAVLEAATTLYEAAQGDEALRVALSVVMEEIARPGVASRDQTPGLRPACRHWDSALEAAEAGPPRTAALGFALRALEPHLPWIQNPNYTADAVGAHFVDNYAYFDIMGPRGLIDSERAAMGLLLMGPGLHYVDHAHEAEEIYVTLTPDSLWSKDRWEWETKPAGSVIHHPPWVPHATKTSEAPLLAFYCWIGALKRHAELI